MALRSLPTPAVLWLSHTYGNVRMGFVFCILGIVFWERGRGWDREQSHVPSQCHSFTFLYFQSHSQHESDTKFILILDRRLDTWTSVKMTLQKIAVSPL